MDGCEGANCGDVTIISADTGTTTRSVITLKEDVFECFMKY